MAKRRTKKQKGSARHPFLTVVKGQNISRHKPKPKESRVTKKASISANRLPIASIKFDIIKSIILVSLILGLELVIYLSLKF